MTPAELLIDSFTRIPPIISKAVEDLSTEQLAHPPTPGTNTIARLAWHTARGQDVQIADLAVTQQIWTASDWSGRFAPPFGPEEMGYGMTEGDVTRVIATEALLAGYLTEVTEALTACLGGLSAKHFDGVVDPYWNPPRHSWRPALEHRQRLPATRRAGVECVRDARLHVERV